MKYLDIDKISSHKSLDWIKLQFMNRWNIFKNNLAVEGELWKKRIRHPRTWFFIGLGLTGLLLITAVSTYIAFAGALANKSSIVNAKNTGTILYDRSGKILYEAGGAHDVQYLNFNQIPDSLKKATISIEDKNFYNEPGFSIDGILRSIYADIATGDPTRYGASTITQQLVRTAFLSPNKSFLRKYQELVLAIEISRRYGKDDVLEMYLNSVYYGAGAYGIQNAAQVYFGIDAKNLDLAQTALLAGLPNAPSYLSPTAGGDAVAAKSRQEQILAKMVEQGYITQAQADQAKTERLKYVAYSQQITAAPHFSLWILQQLKDKYGEDYIGRAGLRVTTSLNLDLQQEAEKDVANRVHQLAGNKVSNGALVSIDPRSGEVLAMVGSADYSNDSIQGKVNDVFSNRQPGSSIKPVVYLKALESQTITAATTLHDVPTDINGYKPTDYDGQWRGNVPARYALAQSLNVPAVEVLNKIGPSAAVEMAQRLHISTLDNAASQCGLSLVLGGCEVQLIELTRAYGVIANYGNYADTSSILKIADRDGNVVYQAPSTPHQQNLVDPQYTYIISDILADQPAKLPTYGAAGVATLTISGHKAAVKTGTTQNFRDSWTIGYTPNIVTGVWVGNNDGSFMDGVAGSFGAAPIWRSFMSYAGNKVGWSDFTPPGGIQRIRVCYSNGLLSSTDAASYMEVFAYGTVPTGQCIVAPPPEASSSGDKNNTGPDSTTSGTPQASGPATHVP